MTNSKALRSTSEECPGIFHTSLKVWICTDVQFNNWPTRRVDIRMSEERRRRKQAGKERGGRIGRGEGGEEEREGGREDG